MAEDEDNLIDFLLAEISQSGIAGCTPAQLISKIEQFYPADSNHLDHESTGTSYPLSKAKTLLPSREKIWEWLSNHPNVSVGKDKQFNHLSLAEIEAILHQGDSAAIIQSVSTNPLRVFFIEESGPGTRDEGSLLHPSTPSKSLNLRRGQKSRELRDQRIAPKLRDHPLTKKKKYLPGTEDFWRDQSFYARNTAEGSSFRYNQAGQSTHPASIALFARRPPQFDEVLVRALDNGLPAPARPWEISKTWIDRTLWMLERSKNGVYISLRGSIPCGWSPAHTSQVLVLKSPRLKEIDFSKRVRFPKVRFFTSSVAHTFRHQSFFSSKQTNKSEPFGPALPITTCDETSKTWNTILEEYKNLPALPAKRTQPLVVENAQTSPNEATRLPEDTQRLGVEELPHDDGTGPRRTSRPSKRRKLSNSPEGEAFLTKRPKKPPRGAVKPRTGSQEGLGKEISHAKSGTINHPESTSQLAPITFYDADRTALKSAENGETRKSWTFIDEQTVLTRVSALPPTLSASNSVIEGPQNPATRTQNEDSSQIDHAITIPADDMAYTTGTTQYPGHITTSNSSLVKEKIIPNESQPIPSFVENLPLVAMTPKGKKPGINRDINGLYRQIVLEVVEDCMGMVPNVFNSISDYLGYKWKGLRKPGGPDKVKSKATMKSLCDNGKLKQYTFTFKTKTGAMKKMSVLLRPDIDTSDTAVRQLQQNMIDALPNDYMPPKGSLPIPLPQEQIPHSYSSQGDATTMVHESIAGTASPIKRSRLKPDSRKDVLGTSIGRNPFLNSGPLRSSVFDGLEPQIFFLYVAEPQPRTQKRKVPEEQLPTRTSRARLVSRRSFRFSRPKIPAIDDGDDFLYDGAEPVSSQPFGRSSRGRKIIWKKQHDEAESLLPSSLPSSLSEILDEQLQRPPPDFSKTDDPEWRRFDWEIDCVELWEQKSLTPFLDQVCDWSFINHTMSRRHVPGFEQNPNFQFQPPDVLQVPGMPTAPRRPMLRVKRGGTQRPQLSRAYRAESDTSVDPDYDPPIRDEKRRRGTGRRSSLRDPRAVQRVQRKAPPRQKKLDGSLPRKKLLRGIQHLRTMSAEDIYRIVIAVVVVRTLAGGIEKYIDWTLVVQLFPDYGEDFLRDRWKTLAIRHVKDIAALTDSFQHKYLSAFEANDVPAIDFDDLPNSDWEGILNWAQRNLDKGSIEEVQELPGTRGELKEAHQLSFEEFTGLRNTLLYTSAATSSVIKGELLSSTPFTIPFRASEEQAHSAIEFSIPAETEATDHELARAKSWALSTILASKEGFNQEMAKEKLSSLADTPEETEELFDRALKAMQRDKIITKNMKAKFAGVSHGGWLIHGKWRDTFQVKRMMTTGMLKKAAAYKRDILDVCFTTPRIGVEIDKGHVMDDGQMVAVLNLSAMGMIRIRVGDGGVPNSRYGLDSEGKGYSTRLMDKNLLSFGVVVKPVEGRYVFGDPLVDMRQPVPGWEDDGEGRIPAWRDLGGILMEENWDMFVVAVLSLISGRPGIGVVEIQRSLGHGLTGWEVNLILEWLREGGFVGKSRSGKGWQTLEWWWMVFGYVL